MFHIYTYQILEDKSKKSLYYEVTTRNKQLQFIKISDYTWEMYYKGIHIANIIPGEIHTVNEFINEITIQTAFDILKQTMLEIIVSDESYQIVESFN